MCRGLYSSVHREGVRGIKRLKLPSGLGLAGGILKCGDALLRMFVHGLLPSS